MELGKRKRRKAGGAKEDGKSKEKVKRAPYFTPAEDALLIQLFTTHKLEYEGEFDAASAGARGAKRSKTDFHVEWANEITALGGINRTPKMVHQRLRHLQKLSKDRLSAERNEIVATGGGLPAPRPQLTEAEAMLDEVNAGSHGISGFPGGFESGSIIESADDSSLQLEPDERTIQVPKGTQRDDEEVLLEDEEEDEPMKKLSVQQLRVRLLESEIKKSELNCKLLQEQLAMQREVHVAEMRLLEQKLHNEREEHEARMQEARSNFCYTE